jgi:Na+-translocating ferredoxin:NAD+ oxidoreductase RnfC subunit
MGKPYQAAPTSGRVKGIYAKALDRPSGKYAVIERAKDFTLVPWRDVLERQRGKSVTGLIRGKTISWTFGKGRGVS